MDVQGVLSIRTVLEAVAARTIVVGTCAVLLKLLRNVLWEHIATGGGTTRNTHGLLRLLWVILSYYKKIYAAIFWSIKIL